MVEVDIGSVCYEFKEFAVTIGFRIKKPTKIDMPQNQSKLIIQKM